MNSPAPANASASTSKFKFPKGPPLVLQAVALTSTAVVVYFLVLKRSVVAGMGFSPIFAELLAVHDAKVAWVVALVCWLGLALRRGGRMERLAGLVGAHPTAVALLYAASLAVAARFVYDAYPLSMDEYAATFQAKIIAAGRLSARWPVSLVDWLLVPGFNGEFLVASHETGQVIGAYWPGFAAVLAPFERLGIPWLCNPMLGGASLWLVHWVAREAWRDERAGGWAMLLAGASSALWANSISFYSMQAHLVCNLAFTALMLRPSAPRMIGAGLIGSLALNLHNPVPHALYALPWLIRLAGRRHFRDLGLLSIGYLPGLLLGIAWWQFKATVADHGASLSTIGWVTHAAFAWPNAQMLDMRLAGLVKMWVWAVPGLPLLAAWGWWQCRGESWANTFAASALVTLLGYFFVRFDQGHGWGYRYFHSAWALLPLLAAGGLVRSGEAAADARSFAGFATMASLTLLVPMQLLQVHGLIERHLALLPAPLRPGFNVYFIRPVNYRYIADMVHVDPWLRTQDLYLSSRGTARDEALVAQNWPNAVREPSSAYVEHWYVGFGRAPSELGFRP